MKGFKNITLMCLLGIALCSIVILMYKWNNRKMNEYKQHIEEVYGSIHFKGKVLKIHKIDRGGRTYGIMCVKLEYTNTDSFYRFDKISCLKIKNGIISLPTNFIGTQEDPNIQPILNAIYIEVNMDNNRQMVFIDNTGNKFSKDLDYPNNNLTEKDLQLCGHSTANNAAKAKKTVRISE